MRRNRPSAVIGIFVLLMASCIEPYKPDLGATASDKYVVFGQISDQEGYQTVTLSLASDVYNQQFKPLLDCFVVIHDDKGNDYEMEEAGSGLYRVWMTSDQLQPGTSYQLQIVTRAGTEIISDFDRMPLCPPVDSVYWKILDSPPDQPGLGIPGLQMYVDIAPGNTGSRYFRWDLTETWEYHSNYLKEWWWNGTIHHTTPPSYELYYCWDTQEIGDIYTLSLDNQSREYL